MRVLIATSNLGKLRDFRAAAALYGIAVEALPGLASLPRVAEDGASFEENARRKAEHYSRLAPGELLLADDSGLVVDALHGEPGVHSARYAAASPWESNSSDEANNAKLLGDLEAVSEAERTARFVCVISAARHGEEVAHFRGEAEGSILRAPRGGHGFGYDPLFFFPRLGKSFAELSAEEKSAASHRGAALRLFLAWATSAESKK